MSCWNSKKTKNPVSSGDGKRFYNASITQFKLIDRFVSTVQQVGTGNTACVRAGYG